MCWTNSSFLHTFPLRGVKPTLLHTFPQTTAPLLCKFLAWRRHSPLLAWSIGGVSAFFLQTRSASRTNTKRHSHALWVQPRECRHPISFNSSVTPLWRLHALYTVSRLPAMVRQQQESFL